MRRVLIGVLGAALAAGTLSMGVGAAQAAPQAAAAASCSISNTVWQVGVNYHAGWTISQLAATYRVGQDQIRAWIHEYDSWVACTRA